MFAEPLVQEAVSPDAGLLIAEGSGHYAVPSWEWPPQYLSAMWDLPEPWGGWAGQEPRGLEAGDKIIGVIIENISDQANAKLARRNFSRLLRVGTKKIRILENGTSVFVRSEDPTLINQCLGLGWGWINQKFGATEPLSIRPVSEPPPGASEPVTDTKGLLESLLAEGTAPRGQPLSLQSLLPAVEPMPPQAPAILAMQAWGYDDGAWCTSPMLANFDPSAVSANPQDPLQQPIHEAHRACQSPVQALFTCETQKPAERSESCRSGWVSA